MAPQPPPPALSSLELQGVQPAPQLQRAVPKQRWVQQHVEHDLHDDEPRDCDFVEHGRLRRKDTENARTRALG